MQYSLKMVRVALDHKVMCASPGIQVRIVPTRMLCHRMNTTERLHAADLGLGDSLMQPVHEVPGHGGVYPSIGPILAEYFGALPEYDGALGAVPTTAHKHKRQLVDVAASTGLWC